MPVFRRHTPPAREIAPDARFAVDDDVRVTETTADGRVLLHTRTARLWVLNRSGALIWDRLSAGAALDQIAGELAARHARDAAAIRQDLIAFARGLTAAGLLRVRSSPP